MLLDFKQEVQLQWILYILKSMSRTSVKPKIITSLSPLRQEAQFINLFLRQAGFRVSWTKRPLLFLTMPTQKSTFSFPEFTSMQKISLFNLFFFLDTVNCRVPWILESPTHFLSCPRKECLINFYLCEFVWTCEKTIYSICLLSK